MMSINNSEQFDRGIFDFAYKFLLRLPNVTDELIDKHIKHNPKNVPRDMSRLYRRLLISAQNTQMSKNVISKSMDNGIDSLRDILMDFSPHLVLEKYSLDWKLLLHDIIQNVSPRGKIRTGPRSIWPRFTQSIIDGAAFLNEFSDLRDFNNWVKKFDEDSRARGGLPMVLGSEIRGFSFALSCDFLKEIGYENFGKPDIHLKTIFYNLQIVYKKDDYQVFWAIDRIANHNNKKPYMVDKLFWLIGSGRFHLEDDLFTGRNRYEFIKEAISELHQYY